MTVSLDRHRGRYAHVVDAVTVAAVLGCAALGASLTIPGIEQPQDDTPGFVLAAVSCLPLWRGRDHPRTAATVATACTVATAALGYVLTPLLLAPLMIALFWVALGTDRLTTRVFGLAAIAMAVITVVLDNNSTEMVLLRTVGPILWLLLPLVGGNGARLRQAYLESVQARAAYAERTREEEARLRVTEERMRIARELHDVVAHHMAVANAQAGTARHLASTHPAQAQKLLDELTATTSSALLELRATVGVLRQAGDPGVESLEPSPGLERLPDLVATCATAGLDVTVTTEGEPLPLSPGVDLTAYRIIQEALTNATKHATDHTAHVRLAYAGSRLKITVTNGGRVAEPPVPGGGFGLMGMRERAHSVGGDLRAGPLPDGGFEVSTALPLQLAAAEEQEATP
ncbi:sensor histidine kinase [Streptomyces cylindrosporus]|uniref:histidine kinase n=1 Tax=Streptomyces cylindrosporus TaxID=2927583 RepID=A0ABS9YDT2_9ACTN|nr:sensor histidine kinase [Streptomyces cylindrosporus]MCI3275379.1 sensor histidine kinase [Streptomyces cylindrosporus]